MKKFSLKKLVTAVAVTTSLVAAATISASACTTIYVGAEQTQEKTPFVARTEDYGWNYNKQWFVMPEGKWAKGDTFLGCPGYGEFEWKFTHDSYRFTYFTNDQYQGTCPECGQKNATHPSYTEFGTNEKGVSVSATETIYGNDAIGGNTKLGEGTYNVADSARQKQLTMTADNCKEVEAALSATTDDPEYQALIDATRADYEKWQAEDGKTLFDSPNWHALQTYLGGGSIDNIELIETYANGAVDSLKWLEDTIGVPFKNDYIFMAIGGKWARGHQVDLVAATGKESDNGGRIYIEKLQQYAEKLGTTIETNAKVTTLTVGDNGAVNGCIAERTDGSTITVNAKTVILATGGYAASSDLVYKYSNGTITTKLTSCAATSTGDGLALAENVGGNLINLDQIQVHPLGDPIDDCGCVSEFVGNWLSATEYMFVNKEGKRFINEDNTRYAISMAELQQTDGQMWLIVDSSAIAGDDSRNELIDKLLNDGHSVKADTLDELAEKIGVDADTLKATVEAYNAGMTSGKDEFGKATSEDSTILQAPFYASLRTPTVHYTMGGIQIDTDAHVLNAEGSIVPGLYAAGEVASGINGNNRLGGNAYPDIITFGRIAGTNAAAEVKS